MVFFSVKVKCIQVKFYRTERNKTDFNLSISSYM